MTKTKIVVLQLKEIIYTAIFIGLGILLILLLVFMFLPKKSSVPSSETAKYIPGKYTSELTLNDTSLNIEVIVDADHINSVSLTNLDDSVSTMYPLMEPALEGIATQLYNNVDINEVVLNDKNPYTQTLLIKSIQSTLVKAAK